MIRGLVVLALFALAACGGEPFTDAATATADAGAMLAADVGAAAVDGELARPDVATIGELELDAGDVDASSSTDAGAGDASSTDADPSSSY